MAAGPPRRCRAGQLNESRLYSLRQRRRPCAKGAVGERRLRDWRRAAAGNLRCRSGDRTTILRCRAGQLNESRLEFPGFTIPPAWPCHAVPPLHKGGFFFAQVDTTGKGKESYGSSVTLAPPGARKRSGKNLVFPREVRCPDGHIFFAFLHRACPARERSMTVQALGPK